MTEGINSLVEPYQGRGGERKKKMKVIVLCDHPFGTSGVGVQARFLLHGLMQTGNYSFRVLGGALRHENYDVAAVSEDLMVLPVNGFGTKEQLRQILVTEQPDALLLFTDPRQFIWVWEMEDEIKQLCPITYWHVWDNDPYPSYNKIWYDSTDLINCLSHKTYELVKPHYPDKTNYIPHAFPKDVYYPLPKEQLAVLKYQQFQEKQNWFKVLWVNRNAHRKMPNDLLLAWKDFLNLLQQQEGHKNAVLIMHTDPLDPEGPNLMASSALLSLQENVWFSNQRVPFEHMNILYNVVDCAVNVSKAEGFGLNTLTAMQVGKPIIALKTGGLTRQVVDYRDGSENGVAIEPSERSLIGSQMTPYIYEDIVNKKALTDAFMKIYKLSPEEREVLGKKAMAYVEHEFSYENMIRSWDLSLRKAIQDFKENKTRQWDVVQLGLKEPLSRVENTMGQIKQPKESGRK